MNNPKQSQRILGIDPGSHSTGFGLIDKLGSKILAIHFGCIRPKAEDFPGRLHTIFDEIVALIDTHQPRAVAVETQFVQKNVASAMKLGMVRGIVMLAAARANLPLFEYAPSKAKLAITGSGRASKEQVMGMVRNLLNLHNTPLAEDAADALMIAICHALVNPRLAHLL